MGLDEEDDRPVPFRYGDGLSTFQLSTDNRYGDVVTFACFCDGCGLCEVAGESERSLFMEVFGWKTKEPRPLVPPSHQSCSGHADQAVIWQEDQAVIWQEDIAAALLRFVIGKLTFTAEHIPNNDL